MTTHLRRLTAGFLLAASVMTLAACGAKSAPDESTPSSSPAGSAAATQPSHADGLSGEEFLDTAADLSGRTVTLQRCSLLTTPAPDGTLACRVLDKSGNEISDSSGLPVDIFVKQADLSPEAQAVVAGCGDFCIVQIRGTLDRATDGTGYMSMTGVNLKAGG